MIDELAKLIHESAVKHGFYKDSKVDISEVFALIHSEWTEAVEEYRAGRPMVWHNCEEQLFNKSDKSPCLPRDEYDCTMYEYRKNCAYRNRKPEGIAAELIDGVMRILSFIGLYEEQSIQERYEEAEPYFYNHMSVTELVCELHFKTVCAYVFMKENLKDSCTVELLKIVKTVINWIEARNDENGEKLDPWLLIDEKRIYNDSRPPMHGKIF